MLHITRESLDSRCFCISNLKIGLQPFLRWPTYSRIWWRGKQAVEAMWQQQLLLQLLLATAACLTMTGTHTKRLDRQRRVEHIRNCNWGCMHKSCVCAFVCHSIFIYSIFYAILALNTTITAPAIANVSQLSTTQPSSSNVTLVRGAGSFFTYRLGKKWGGGESLVRRL